MSLASVLAKAISLFAVGSDQLYTPSAYSLNEGRATGKEANKGTPGIKGLNGKSAFVREALLDRK